MDISTAIATILAAFHGFNTLIRPQIPAASWAKLGAVGRVVDVLLGNYGNTANIPVIDEQK